jgi:cytosine/uracil/thiamine/allantoin permease
MKFTLGAVFLLMGALLVSVGFAVPSQNHQSLGLIDIVTMLLFWVLSILIIAFHDEVFRKGRILLVVLPVLALAFVWLMLNLAYIISFGIKDFNIYAILLGWAFFNSGLYYDTRGFVKAAKR